MLPYLEPLIKLGQLQNQSKLGSSVWVQGQEVGVGNREEEGRGERIEITFYCYSHL